MKNTYQKNFILRFHLGRGKHYKMWRLKNVKTGEVTFHNPNEVSFEITNGFLRNQKTTANKIHDGANKEVCAWIEAEAVDLTVSDDNTSLGAMLRYNPKVAPNWILLGENVDYHSFPKLYTQGNKVYLLNEDK